VESFLPNCNARKAFTNAKTNAIATWVFSIVLNKVGDYKFP
jgi:hypothetical protein